MALCSVVSPTPTPLWPHAPRERLTRRVLAASRLCLLNAPAGFGKTALLKECRAQLPARTRCCWLSLQGRMLSLTDFCAALALQLELPGEQSPDALLEHLLRSSMPLCLVLDGYPEQAAESLDEWLQNLLREGPSTLRLWLATRRRPRWRLAQLALEEGVAELGADSLAFTREELASLLSLYGRSDDCDELWDATLGWCAMVRLALQGGDDPSRPAALRQREFVREECLAWLTDAQRQMLWGIAHLPRVSAGLCCELWPELESSRAFAAELLPLGVLLPLDADARWWRMHPAIALALVDDLPPREVGRLRLQACRLLREAGFVGDAVELALQEGQVDTAASYMERVPLAWLFAGQHLDSWLRWRERLSLRLLESTPFLIYLNAQALLISWRLDEAGACIERLGWQLPQPCAQHQRRMLANWEALQGTLLGLRGFADEARSHCRSALEDLDARDWHSLYLCYSTLARIAMSEGLVDQSEELLDRALRVARQQGCLASEVLIDTDRVRLLIMTGEWQLAAELLRHDFQLIEQRDADYPLLAGRLHLLAGELDVLQGELDTGESHFLRGVAYARRCGDPFILHSGLGLSEIAAYRGDLAQGRTRLREVQRHLQCLGVAPVCYEQVLALQELRLLGREQRWTEMLGGARRLVAELSGAGVLPPLNAPSLRYRAQQVLALTLEGTGRRTAALQASRQWREECERLGFAGLTRPRADSASLARVASEELPEATLARVLTRREMGVLQLMAEGLTNQEISGRLFISLNTVKAHTIHINHKLGVKRRTQAVTRARELGLLG